MPRRAAKHLTLFRKVKDSSDLKKCERLCLTANFLTRRKEKHSQAKHFVLGQCGDGLPGHLGERRAMKFYARRMKRGLPLGETRSLRSSRRAQTLYCWTKFLTTSLAREEER